MAFTVGSEVLVLTSDAQALDAAANHAPDPGWLTMQPRNLGEVLRQIHLCSPRTVLVHVRDAAQVEASSALIAQLRRRFPKLLLVAFTRQHSDLLERSVRQAGATCYVPKFPSQGFVRSLHKTARVAHMTLPSGWHPSPVVTRSHSPPSRCLDPPDHEKPP